MGGRLTGKESEYDKLMAQNVETLSGYGDNLMDVLCRDACDGHHVCRVSARTQAMCAHTSNNTGAWFKSFLCMYRTKKPCYLLKIACVSINLKCAFLSMIACVSDHLKVLMLLNNDMIYSG